MRWCAARTGRLVGGSTGTALWGAVQLIAEMRREGTQGSVVTLLCDGGERYQQTYYNDSWLAAQGLDLTPYTAVLAGFAASGECADPLAVH